MRRLNFRPVENAPAQPEAPVCLEGRSTLDPDGASSTVPRRKHLQWDLLVMPVTLEAIRTIQVTFFLVS